MSRSIASPIHSAAIELIIKNRKSSGLTQTMVAKKLGRHQSFIATIESGQRRLDVVDIFDFADAIGFDPVEFIREIKNKK